MKLQRIAALIILSLAGTVTAGLISSPAHAADKRTTITVQLAHNVNASAYDLNHAISYINSITTKTRLVRGTCKNGTLRCIKISYTKLPSTQVAIGSPPWWSQDGFVKLDPKTSKRSYAERRITMLHELGHTRNVGHNHSCKSAMYYRIGCNGHVTPYVYDWNDKKVLRLQ